MNPTKEYLEILQQMREHYPTLRDDQLLMTMFVLEDVNEDDIRQIARDGKLFSFTVQEISKFTTL